MPPIEVTGRHDPHDYMYEVFAKEGERQIKIFADMEDRKIEFSYYDLKEWQYCPDPFTDEDRARLAAAIADHYTAQGYQVVLDRRRFCPRCHDRMNGSEREDWPGGLCEFCGKELDRFGNIVQ